MTNDPTIDLAVPIGREPYRPRAHFTPRRNWINDPNGLVYFEGEYHLYYQYNPEGREWGHMSWGHAVSPDLAHWKELPVAIPETDQMIFSGSIVVDWGNRSGLGNGNAPPLLAFFTAFDAARGIQSQHLAYSHDRGRSFVHYVDNPIVDLDHADFRDPKVFYHEQSAAWIMVVALSKDHVVQIYRSENLLNWQLASTFGPEGSTTGQWECPDLIPVPIEGEGQLAWVLKVDVDDGFLGGGSGAQYFVGDFDGFCFTLDATCANPDGNRVDYGPDFYAAITWAELPTTQPGPIWIGWQSNHQSGRLYPTDPWQGAMSFPRRLFLYRGGGRLHLGQEPILSDLQGPTPDASLEMPVELTIKPTIVVADLVAFDCSFNLTCSDQACATIDLRDKYESLVSITVDRERGEIAFERAPSSKVDTQAFQRSTSGLISQKSHTLRIIVDGPLVEIFIDAGKLVYTGTIFPNGVPSIAVKGVSGSNLLTAVRIEELQPTMFDADRDADTRCA